MTNDVYRKKREELEKRTKELAIKTINVCGGVPRTIPNNVVTTQLIRSCCSIGANYREACEPESKVDFCHKLGIAKKEANETLYWLEILAETNPAIKDKIRPIYAEAKEILLIFAKAIATSKSSLSSK